MAVQRFSLIATGNEIRVDVEWSRWSYAGVVWVDGKVVTRWDKGKWVPKAVEFEINGHPAIIKRTGWLVEKWELTYGGVKYK